jgi:hypothetical protein
LSGGVTGDEILSVFPVANTGSSAADCIVTHQISITPEAESKFRFIYEYLHILTFSPSRKLSDTHVFPKP